MAVVQGMTCTNREMVQIFTIWIEWKDWVFNQVNFTKRGSNSAFGMTSSCMSKQFGTRLRRTLGLASEFSAETLLKGFDSTCTGTLGKCCVDVTR